MWPRPFASFDQGGCASEPNRSADLGRPGTPEFVAIPESDQPVIRYPLLGTKIHAPTAAVMYQFMEVALLGRATRVAHLEQPVWAWR